MHTVHGADSGMVMTDMDIDSLPQDDMPLVNAENNDSNGAPGAAPVGEVPEQSYMEDMDDVPVLGADIPEPTGPTGTDSEAHDTDEDPIPQVGPWPTFEYMREHHPEWHSMPRNTDGTSKLEYDGTPVIGKMVLSGTLKKHPALYYDGVHLNPLRAATGTTHAKAAALKGNGKTSQCGFVRCDAKPMPQANTMQIPTRCQPDTNQMPTRCQPDANQMPRKMPIRCRIGDMSYIHACPMEYSGIPSTLPRALAIERELLVERRRRLGSSRLAASASARPTERPVAPRPR